MRSFQPWLTIAVGLTSMAAAACSSTENATDGGAGGSPAGAGGAGADMSMSMSGSTAGGTGSMPRDTSCLDGSDGCVWSCGAGAETGSGDSPYPTCDANGKLQCPTGSQTLSSCPVGSCARFGGYCCNATTGQVGPPPCKPDGFRDVCPPGSSADFTRCVPAGVTVTNCVELDQQVCTSLDLRCYGGGDCSCVARGDGAMYWDCPPFIP